jgi:hypothetical protein
VLPSEAEVDLGRTNTTTVTIDFDSSGQIVSLTVVTSDGSPIPDAVWFRIWLFVKPEITTDAVDTIWAAKEQYGYGPFLVQSIKDENGDLKLDIDVDDLRYEDGTRGSIPGGSYTIKFVENTDTPTLVGEVDDVELPATKTRVDPDDDSLARDSGGGCDAGFGALGFVGALAVLTVAAKGARGRRERL